MYKAQYKYMNRTICSILVSLDILLFSTVRWVWQRVLCYLVIASFRLKCSNPIGIVHKICKRLFAVFVKSHVFKKTAGKH